MKSNYKKLIIYLSVAAVPVIGLVSGLERFRAISQSLGKGRWSEAPAIAKRPLDLGSGGHLLSEGEALRARDVRHGRSPAYVPGSMRDLKLKMAVDHLLADSKVAAANGRLAGFFPDSSSVNYWIRAAMALGTVPIGGPMSAENLAAIGHVYAQVLSGEESSVAALQAGLQSLPKTEGAFRQQAFRMLSDLGLQNPDLRDDVKRVLVSEAVRARKTPDAALAFSALLRINPTKEWYQEVNSAYETAHPGMELSDFLSLNVANL